MLLALVLLDGLREDADVLVSLLQQVVQTLVLLLIDQLTIALLVFGHQSLFVQSCNVLRVNENIIWKRNT